MNAEMVLFYPFYVYSEWRKDFHSLFLQCHMSPHSSLTSHQSLPSCFRGCIQSVHILCYHLSVLVSFFFNLAEYSVCSKCYEW